MNRLNMLALVTLLSVAGCGGAVPTPKSTVAAMEASLTGANSLAMPYLTLPRCGTTTSQVCSDQKTVDAIKASSKKAYDAVTTAQMAVELDPTATQVSTTTALAAAKAALAALETVIPPPTADLPKKV